MPTYTFECQKCETQFEELFLNKSDSSIEEQVDCYCCPKCGSAKKNRLIEGCCGVTFTNPGDTGKYNTHDYRWKHKLESDRQLRETAEKKSHVGANPYKDDPTSGDADIQSGKYFGEVK